MESKKKEIEVRELAEQFFEEAVNQLDDQERKEEVEAERETYIGVWMRGYRAGEAAPAAGREEDAVLGILQYISESEFYYNHAEKAWLIKGTHSIKLTHNELSEKYELFKQQKEAK